MAKNRYINTKFWDDNYISELDPIEKLLFLYLLTNPITNIAGIYEIPLRRIAFDTGIDSDMVKKILERFERDKKIFYKDGWIIIKNFIHHQAINPKVKKGIASLIQNDIPNDILQETAKMGINLSYFEDLFLPETSRNKNIRKILKGENTCSDCGEVYDKEDLIIHHKTPLFEGGDNSKENLEILCVTCHKEKHSLIGYDSLSKATNYSNSNSNTNYNTNSNSKAKASQVNFVSEIIKLFEEVNPVCKKYYGNTTQRSAIENLLELHSFERIKEIVQILPQTNSMLYVPTITTPHQLEQKWVQLESALKKKKNEIKSKKREVI